VHNIELGRIFHRWLTIVRTTSFRFEEPGRESPATVVHYGPALEINAIILFFWLRSRAGFARLRVFAS